MKKLLILATLALLAACNTIDGAGKDLQGAGEWTSNSAEKVKDKINGQ